MHNISACFYFIMYMLIGLYKEQVAQYTNKEPKMLKKDYGWSIEFIIYSILLLILFQFYDDSSFVPYFLSFIITIVFYIIYLCYIWSKIINK